MAASSEFSAPDSPSGRRTERPSRGRILGSLLVALAIVAAAWFIGGREGLGAVGKGGINQKILPRAGEVAPDFTTVDLLGNTVKLSDFRGQPVWLNFWGSWCPPCRAEMPDLQTAFEQLKPKGVVLLAVSLDEPALNAAVFAARNKASFQILSDPSRSDTGVAYPIMNFPTHLFIDRDGIVKRVVLSELSVEDALKYGNEIASPK